jgi:hypothetical protein
MLAVLQTQKSQRHKEKRDHAGCLRSRLDGRLHLVAGLPATLVLAACLFYGLS